MTISVICPKCGRQFSKIKSELAGKKVRCACGESLRLPENNPANLPMESDQSRAGESIGTVRTSSSKDLKRSTSSRDSKETANSARNPFELHYSDLDLILAKPESADSDFDPFATRQNPRTVPQVAFPTETTIDPAEAPVPASGPNAAKMGSTAKGAFSIDQDGDKSAGSFRIGFLFLLATIASITAFGLAMFLLSARLASTNFIWQGLPDEIFRQIYAGQFGMDAITPGLKLGFQLLGWVIVGMASVLMLLGSLQMVIAGIQLYAPLRLLRWVDGMMATIAVTMLFLLIGVLFLHGSHTQNLKRQINQVTLLAEGEEPPNIQRLRAQLQADTADFQRTIAGICAAPATIFGCSMLRLFARV